jgi:hypothetical protein
MEDCVSSIKLITEDSVETLYINLSLSTAPPQEKRHN